MTTNYSVSNISTNNGLSHVQAPVVSDAIAVNLAIFTFLVDHRGTMLDGVISWTMDVMLKYWIWFNGLELGPEVCHALATAV